MIGTRVEAAMRELELELTQCVVLRLAERYSFDATDALKWLGQERLSKRSKDIPSEKKGGERIIP